MKTKILCFSTLVMLAFASCKETAPANKENTADQTESDTSIDLTSRTSNVKAMNPEQIFLRIPQENIQLEGWNKLSPKYRKELLQKGNLDELKATIKGNHLQVAENFQNEDDENERAAIFDMILFPHEEEDYLLVFVSQKYSNEDTHLPDEIISQGFLKYDGKDWVPFTEGIPSIKTAMFFDKGFDVSKAKEDFINWEAGVNENTLNATLQYDKYSKFGLKPEVLIKNETHIINLIWNGQMFELQRKPHNLK